MLSRRLVLLLSAGLFSSWTPVAVLAAEMTTFIRQDGYSSFADSPWYAFRDDSSFVLEDFEDRQFPEGVREFRGRLNGINRGSLFLFPPVFVEGDVGVGGMGFGLHSNLQVYHPTFPATFRSVITLDFLDESLEDLPTAVGLVVTLSQLGATSSGLRFEYQVYSRDESLLSTESFEISPSEAAEGVFLGALDSHGIGSISLWTANVDRDAVFAVDDFQFMRIVPEPSSGASAAIALLLCVLCRTSGICTVEQGRGVRS